MVEKGSDPVVALGWDGVRMALPPRGLRDAVTRRFRSKRSQAPPTEVPATRQADVQEARRALEAGAGFEWVVNDPMGDRLAKLWCWMREVWFWETTALLLTLMAPLWQLSGVPWARWESLLRRPSTNFWETHVRLDRRPTNQPM